MASTKAPLFGLDASGTIGGAIVFSKWRGRTYVRRHVVPANPKTGLQVGMRSGMKFISQNWSSLTTTQQSAWANLASTDNITTLNASVRSNQTRTRQNEGVQRTPTESAGTTPDAPTVTATAGPKTVNLAITAGVNAPEYTWYVYRSTTSGFSSDVSNLIAILDQSKTAYADPKLTTGTTYYYLVLGGNFDGTLGTASAEASATPT